MVKNDIKTFPSMKNIGWFSIVKIITECGKVLCNEAVADPYSEPCQTHLWWVAF